MFNIFKKNKTLSGLLFGLALVHLSALPLNAQDKSSNLPENIEVEAENSWEFSSENESISVRDDIRELGNYTVDNSETLGLEINERNNKWYNQNYGRRYTIETEVYDY